MTKTKRILAFLLSLALVLSFLPANVFAADGDVYKLNNGYIEVSVSKKTAASWSTPPRATC